MFPPPMKCGHILRPVKLPPSPQITNNTMQAREVFDRLRAFDDTDVKQIWAQCPSDEGLGLAVANRIKKAAGFSVIQL